MPRNKAPHPPDETPDELMAALRRNHPELTEGQLHALLTGEPPRRQRSRAANRNLTAGVKGASGAGMVRARGLSRSLGRRRGRAR